jgi:prevent-host-death family protein
MEENRLTISEVREDFAETLNRVAYRGERIIIHRREKNLAAIIPIEDLMLLEELEDQSDIKAAREALAESDERIPYAEIREGLAANVRDTSDASSAARSRRPAKGRVQTRSKKDSSPGRKSSSSRDKETRR